MRRGLWLIMTLALTGCAGLPAAPSVDSAKTTPIVIVQTVLVPQPVSNSGSTSASPVPNQPAAATQAAPVFTTPMAVPVTGPIAIPASFNGKSFSNMSVSGDIFSLRCEPKEISFDVTTTDVYITQVDLYIRLRDKHSTFVPNWGWGRTLKTDGLYHFWITIHGYDVPPDLRKKQAWFDFEFVGMNKFGDAIGRTEKITDIVSYKIDC